MRVSADRAARGGKGGRAHADGTHVARAPRFDRVAHRAAVEGTVNRPARDDVRREPVRELPWWERKSLAQLEDELVEAYVCWREACADVEGAYAGLDKAQRRDRGVAFAAFDAALDREQCAAVAYREATECLLGSVNADAAAVR